MKGIDYHIFKRNKNYHLQEKYFHNLGIQFFFIIYILIS